ncbi:MAG: hypothetical protein O2887_11530 [Bacteroidetes bacterium]|nr:hypothetical protein [Bacteroidota bacterium]MDA1121102.1 hypothetical protein [Bacteroidota bacterium]
MQKISAELLSTWNQYGVWAAYAIAGIGVLILLAHLFKLMTAKDFKSKYDYINMHEINFLWYSALLIIIGGTIYTNTIRDESTVIIFIIWIVVSGMMAGIVSVVVQQILKFYYPFYIEKRLKALRYTPRTNPENGNKMKLLSEEEEDVYLDEGMQAEENAFSVDYDVWMDESTGYTKIEKYNGRLHALKCSECNYQTLRVTKEEVIKDATHEEEGELMKYYDCGYCGHKQRKSFKIAQLRDTPA